MGLPPPWSSVANPTSPHTHFHSHFYSQHNHHHHSYLSSDSGFPLSPSLAFPPPTNDFCETILSIPAAAATTCRTSSCNACRIGFATLVPKSYRPSGSQASKRHAFQRHLGQTYRIWLRSLFKPTEGSLSHFERLNCNSFCSPLAFLSLGLFFCCTHLFLFLFLPSLPVVDTPYPTCLYFSHYRHAFHHPSLCNMRNTSVVILRRHPCLKPSSILFQSLSKCCPIARTSHCPFLADVASDNNTKNLKNTTNLANRTSTYP